MQRTYYGETTAMGILCDAPSSSSVRGGSGRQQLLGKRGIMWEREVWGIILFPVGEGSMDEDLVE